MGAAGNIAVDGSTEQEKAILAHAVYVYAWLDPATGAREKICTRPYADGYFHNYYDGRIYYTGNFRNADTPGQQAALLYFDTADGTAATGVLPAAGSMR